MILAVERSLEIIGEAVGQLDDAFKDAYPEIPWRSICGLRNVLAHMYWAVNLDPVWGVVSEDIPTLHEEIGRVLDSLPEQR